jgi:Cys-tRNA(Pro)/Cys-tRNA(Cys) deacylase
MTIKKLNSMRFLESQGVKYEVLTYDESVHNAVEAAQAMGYPPSQVYKTLVVQPEGSSKYVLVMIPGDHTLDLKRFAREIGQKKVNMPTKRDAEAATGLKTGGIGALALTQKHWAVYLDQDANEQEFIMVNAGQRGVNLKVNVKDLIRVLNVKIVDAADPGDDSSGG